MSVSYEEIVLFGDLTCDYAAGLLSLVSIKENALLSSFFERATFALRQEIGQLAASERTRFPSFITFSELVAAIQKKPSVHPALEKALVCVYQLACFIRHYTSPGKRFPSPNDSTTSIVGLCTGLLSASAVSCCQSVTDLVPLAAHTILVAFRTGLCVSEVRDRIETQKDGAPAPWSVLIPGLDGDTADSILKCYAQDKCLPATSAPYVSTIAKAGLTLSGPPSTLSDLLSSNYLPSNRSLSISIHAPYHAPHLYRAEDVDRIVERTRRSDFHSYRRQLTMRSSVHGGPIGVDTYGELIVDSLKAILREPLRADHMATALSQDLAASGRSCTLLPIATLAGQSFAATLSKLSMVDVSVDPSMNSSVAVRSDAEQDGTSATGHLAHSKLAIIGYSGRYPDAKSNEDFWKLLIEGRDVASFTPSNRWDHRTHVDPTLKRKNTMGTPYGCWLLDPGLFDANFFMISPREAPQIDPAQRLALMTAYEAMEFAGFVPDSSPSTQSDRVGVFYGTTSNDWGEINSSQNVDTYYIPGSCRAFIPGRQNFFYKFSGPSYSVDTACSSSLAALHLACNSLLKGDIDTAFCGGTNVLTNPDISAGLDRGHFLSRTGNCKTFDDDADGYCRGEGVCTLIIKRLEDAKADNDPICGLILGAYTNHSAEAESITRPHVGAQKAIFEKVLTSAAVDPESVDCIEMHGTGTQAGDAREMKSVLSVFSDGRQRSQEKKLYLGSVKANVGHGESVSGVIALIKSLMMMERNKIPPHVGIKNKINSGFPTDLAKRNVYIANELTEWQRPEGSGRRVMINNFSAAGGNSSVLIEDPPLALTGRIASPTDTRSTHMVAVGAKSSTALTANIKSLLAFIDKEAPSLANLSYTTTARRMHHPYRVMASGSELSDIRSQLEKKLDSPKLSQKVRAMPHVAFAFTGQGSQWLGMMTELLKFHSFRRDMERFGALCEALGFPSIAPLWQQTDGDISELPPLVTQVGTTCMQMAMTRLWRSWGVEPAMVVGHSLGEYAALHASGALSEADTIFLCGTRAKLIQDDISFDTHSMLAVSTTVDEVHRICDGLDYEIACINAPSETVLSGTNDQIDEALQRMSETAGLRKTKLKVPFAFHSSQMQPILDMFKAATRAVRFQDPKIPVISPLLGEVLTTKEALGPEYLARHCRETVDFVAGLEAAQAKSSLRSSTLWVEIGAHPVVSGLLRTNLGAATTTYPTLQRNKDTWKTLAGTLAALYESGVDIRWAEYHRSFAGSLSVIRLPSYNWDLKEYWMQYTGDWTLYKGSIDFRQGPPALSTTCVHRLVEEKKDEDSILVVGEVDVLRDDVDHFVRGHRVNNVPLVTPSVYAEMALVLGEYLRKQQPGLADSLVDLQHMDVQRPFATKKKGSGPQLLRCCIALDTGTWEARVEFWSVTPEGKKLVRHAEASMSFPDRKAAHAEVTAQAGPILERMRAMAARLVTSDRVQKLTGKTGYQLVSSLAGYDPEYMGVSGVLLDSAQLEAVATVDFAGQPRKPAGVFHVNPYLIDNFGQPALFIMNANDRADLSKEVFVNHGWTSLHFYKPVSMDAAYRSHVQMKGPDADGLYKGDMVVFDSQDDIVALYKGIKAQGVPRRLMDYIVHMRDDTKAPGAGMAGATADAPAGMDIQVMASAGAQDTWPAALKIISEESSVPVAELQPEAVFADLGLDSLLSLLCASRFREELGLHYESSIFLENQTLAELEAFWKRDGASSDEAAPARALTGNDAVLNSMFAADADAELGSSTQSSGPASLLADDANGSPKPASSATGSDTDGCTTPPVPKPDVVVVAAAAVAAGSIQATSLLLQGNPAHQSTAKTLFLLPDGSGSCSSYAALPRVHPSVAVVGVNCPFMKTPEDYTVGIGPVGAAYVREIRRRQPSGPYALGGWSVGGIFAFHVAQELAAQGDEVTELVLIDCPVPRGLDHLPRRYYDYCNDIGLLGTVNGVRRAPPPWLVGHFEACVDSLHDHYAEPFHPEESAPRTQIIWACDAIDKNLEPKFESRPDDPEGLKFLTTARTDFGPSGWETLLPESGIAIDRIEGCNHFSMMQAEGAKQLSEVLEGFLMNGN